MQSYPVKENHISSTPSEILRDRETEILLIYYWNFKKRFRNLVSMYKTTNFENILVVPCLMQLLEF